MVMYHHSIVVVSPELSNYNRGDVESLLNKEYLLFLYLLVGSMPAVLLLFAIS